uniref:Cation-transporting P-type ATPase N-terminal domain-containing protein n=1 Tax=Romanomermis culicivorax TaxID=13658 RepID=A0A915I3U9_ROMCU
MNNVFDTLLSLPKILVACGWFFQTLVFATQNCRITRRSYSDKMTGKAAMERDDAAAAPHKTADLESLKKEIQMDRTEHQSPPLAFSAMSPTSGWGTATKWWDGRRRVVDAVCTFHDEHIIPMNQLLKRLETSLETGLSSSAAATRLLRDGPNSLTPPKQTPWYVKLFLCLFGGFAALLWTGSILCFIAYGVEKATAEHANNDNVYLGTVLAVVVVITGCFQYYQESKSSAIMEKFKQMVPPKAKVKRDGQFGELNAADIVVGDIVEVVGGDRIPADIRLIQVFGMKVDNSTMTGEAEAQTRGIECTNPNPKETKNLIFFSTNCVEDKKIKTPPRSKIQIGIICEKEEFWANLTWLFTAAACHLYSLVEAFLD